MKVNVAVIGMYLWCITYIEHDNKLKALLNYPATHN